MPLMKSVLIAVQLSGGITSLLNPAVCSLFVERRCSSSSWDESLFDEQAESLGGRRFNVVCSEFPAELCITKFQSLCVCGLARAPLRRMTIAAGLRSVSPRRRRRLPSLGKCIDNDVCILFFSSSSIIHFYLVLHKT